MLIFFAFDNDDMESSKRRVTLFIVDFSFKMNVEIDRYQMTILLLYLVAWWNLNFAAIGNPLTKEFWQIIGLNDTDISAPAHQAT